MTDRIEGGGVVTTVRHKRIVRGVYDGKSAAIVAALAGAAFICCLIGVATGEGPNRGMAALGAIINGVLVVLTVASYRARRRGERDSPSG